MAYQKTIEDYKRDYAAAAAAGDAAGMKAANDGANAIRVANGQKAEYATADINNVANGGTSGIVTNPSAWDTGGYKPSSSGGGSSNNTYSPTGGVNYGSSGPTWAGNTDYSTIIQDAIASGFSDPDKLQEWVNTRIDKSLGTPGLEQYAFDAITQQAQEYINDLLAKQQQAQMPSYGGSSWDSVVETAANQLFNMSFDDWMKGDQYQKLAERYGREGKMSMQDLLGQISSRTGGLSSSWAATAAQQQYNDFMATLNQAAMEMYGAERGDIMENAKFAQSLAQQDYNRYLDSLDQYNANRNYQYGISRDEIEDARYADKQALAKAETLAAYGDFSGYRELGYPEYQIANMEANYRSEQAAKNAPKKEEERSLSTDYDGLFEAALASGHPESFIANKYKEYGFANATGLYKEYEEWVDAGAMRDQKVVDDAKKFLGQHAGVSPNSRTVSDYLASTDFSSEEKELFKEYLREYSKDAGYMR